MRFKQYPDLRRVNRRRKVRHMETKKWIVDYDHKDGRAGRVEATTEIMKSGGFQYGNGKSGALTIKGYQPVVYDLRYNHGDLHRLMLADYFGKGLVRATEID